MRLPSLDFSERRPGAACFRIRMARTWLITSRGIARKVKNPNYFTNYHAKDVAAEANRECPNCKQLIDNSDVSLDWPGLPAGVKFDPSDVELLEHLAGKIGVQNSKPHILIDEFIPMLEEHEGICYTHPENLPGVKKDGSSIHFFHKISNAYGTGQRKRRKINQCTSSKERVRWHKTGKTKPVLENGVQKGWKKIMVLYKSTKKGSKPDRANWVMHQYHLGPEEDEKEGQVVVSKVFCQQSSNQFDRGDMDSVNGESDICLVKVGPITPKTNTPQPPRLKKDSLHETEHNLLPLLDQEQQLPAVSWVPDSPLGLNLPKSEGETPAWWAGESQTIELDASNLHETLLCHEVLDSFPPFEDSPLHFDCTKLDCGENESVGAINNTSCGISDLENILMDTPPDFQLGDLQFGSQESITSWLDRF